MKALKDIKVSDHLYYLVLAYLGETNCEPIYKRHLETYYTDGRPMFSLLTVSHDIFVELVDEAVIYFKNQSKK